MKKLFCAACAFGFGAVSAFAAVYEFRDRSKDVSYLDASYWQIYFESSTVPATTPPSSGDAVYVTSGNDIEVFVVGFGGLFIYSFQAVFVVIASFPRKGRLCVSNAVFFRREISFSGIQDK